MSKYDPLEEAKRRIEQFNGPSIVFIEGDPIARRRFDEVYPLAEMHKNATGSGLHACPRCSRLSSLLSQMASNPPGFNGIETPKGRLGNAHIDFGWLAAVDMLKRALSTEG